MTWLYTLDAAGLGRCCEVTCDGCGRSEPPSYKGFTLPEQGWQTIYLKGGRDRDDELHSCGDPACEAAVRLADNLHGGGPR